jgi:hypothetical protein
LCADLEHIAVSAVKPPLDGLLDGVKSDLAVKDAAIIAQANFVLHNFDPFRPVGLPLIFTVTKVYHRV